MYINVKLLNRWEKLCPPVCHPKDGREGFVCEVMMHGRSTQRLRGEAEYGCHCSRALEPVVSSVDRHSIDNAKVDDVRRVCVCVCACMFVERSRKDDRLKIQCPDGESMNAVLRTERRRRPPPQDWPSEYGWGRRSENVRRSVRRSQCKVERQLSKGGSSLVTSFTRE